MAEQNKSKRLTKETRDSIRKQVHDIIANPANKGVEGDVLTTWIFSMLENCHLHNWFEE